MPRMEAWEAYHSKFALDEAKNATPEPARVIFEVDDMYQKRFGLPCFSASAITSGLSGSAPVRLWMA